MSRLNKEAMMELTSLASERKMGEMAIKSEQNSLYHKLNGEMGRDMMEVLNGKKKIKLTFSQKIRYKLENFFKLIFGGYDNGEY